jgi:voltage-gated potassium channel Kch
MTTRGRRRRIYLLALLLVLGLFFFHSVVLFDVAGLLIDSQDWLVALLGPHRIGKAAILACFLILFAAHLVEAAAWGLFLRWQGLVSTFSDGLYFAAATITTLGYGDVVLPPPWRQIGPLIGIAGVLKFGCSTAFLFVLMQTVWERNL